MWHTVQAVAECFITCTSLHYSSTLTYIDIPLDSFPCSRASEIQEWSPRVRQGHQLPCPYHHPNWGPRHSVGDRRTGDMVPFVATNISLQTRGSNIWHCIHPCGLFLICLTTSFKKGFQAIFETLLSRAKLREQMSFQTHDLAWTAQVL